MKKFINLLKTKVFWINILGIIIFFALCIGVLMLSMRSCTRHGEVVTIPTVVGMDVNKAIALLDDEDFDYEIIDTVIVDTLPKGVVVEQNPAKESLVKPGRTIYMKINTLEDVYVEMPDFVDTQIKSLKVALKNNNLKLGKIKYQNSGNVVNIVLKQMYNGRTIEPGTKIKRGSQIDFVVAGRDPSIVVEENEEESDSNPSDNQPSDEPESGDEHVEAEEESDN